MGLVQTLFFVQWQCRHEAQYGAGDANRDQYYSVVFWVDDVLHVREVLIHSADYHQSQREPHGLGVHSTPSSASHLITS